MRPAEFTSEQIIRAGQELQAVGRNITGFALRQKVGGGNPSRLKQIWDEFINNQTATKTEPVAELPIEVADEVVAVTKALTERLASLAVELNDKAIKAAERRVAEIIRTAGKQHEQDERELADASQTVEDLETKLDEAKSAAGALEKQLANMQTAHQAQSVELAQIRERLAFIEQSVKTTAKEHATALAEAKQIALDAKADRDMAREEAARLRGQVELLQFQAKDLVRPLAAGAENKTTPRDEKPVIE